MKQRYVQTGRGYRLSLQWYPGSSSAVSRPLCILCHGLGVDSSHPLITTIRRSLTNEGYAVCTFDFAGHGKSGGSIRHRLVSSFIRDLHTIVTYVRSKQAADSGIVLIGYSIGALASLVYAVRHPASLRSIVCIACNAEVKKKRLQLEKQGRMRTYARYLIVGRTKVAKNFWSDRVRFDPKAYAARLIMPVCFIVGTHDRTNPARESRTLYRLVRAKKRLDLIPRADHYFRPKTHQRAVARTIRKWLHA